MAETYTITLGYESNVVNAGGEDTAPLIEYGLTDEDWDEMTEKEQTKFLDECASDNFWNQGFDFWGKVDK